MSNYPDINSSNSKDNSSHLGSDQTSKDASSHTGTDIKQNAKPAWENMGKEPNVGNMITKSENPSIIVGSDHTSKDATTLQPAELNPRKNANDNPFAHEDHDVNPESRPVANASSNLDIAISVCHVYKSFKGEPILKDINRDFELGKIHGIIGNNGSGKTVLFKCICGFLLPSKGKILVDYEQVGKDVDFPGDMGVIIETPGFLPSYSGLKNLSILASLKRKIGKKEIRKAIARVGLDPDMKKPVSKYSLGMRQRLGLAQAIMEDPHHLILDEPFSGLDKYGVREMRDLMKELRSEGKTILISSHNPEDIAELCDTVCEMDAGVLSVIRE